MIPQEIDTDTADLGLRLDITPRQPFSSETAPASPPALADSKAVSLTSSSFPQTLKTNFDGQLLDHDDDELPTNMAPSLPAQPSVDSLSDAEEHHASPLDELLSPTASSATQTQSFVRDSVAGSDFGEVGLDDERFSTVSLNAATARGSTVAVKSPVHEKAPKLWEEEEPPLAPSELSSTSVRASLLLQRLGNDATPSRRSLDGQHMLQEVFERAQRDSQDLEGELASVDWGECFLLYSRYGFN
jgi:hypothetical protein